MRSYVAYGEGLFIVQMLWMLLLLTMMMAIFGHIAINTEEADQEGLSVRNLNQLDSASYRNLQISKHFMTVIVIVQVC